MEERLNPYKTAPKVYQAMLVQQRDSEPQHYREAPAGLGEDTRFPDQWLCLLRGHAYQGCSRAAGETEQRLYMLDAWREATGIRSGNERRLNGPKRCCGWDAAR